MTESEHCPATVNDRWLGNFAVGADNEPWQWCPNDAPPATVTMENSVLPSTFFLTFLMVIGMGFFIRAAAKDRTQVVTLRSASSGDQLLAALKQYFADRAYQVEAIDPESNKVTLSGQVRPSVFLTVFLSVMAAVGGLCLGLLLTMAIPALPQAIGLVFVALAPGAGWLYWRKAGRTEQVAFVLDETTPLAAGSLLKVSAHRDELESLRRSLNLTVQE
jgi:Cofactor assembly of complex C subunit B